MKTMIHSAAMLILLILLLTGCNLPQGGNPGIDNGALETKVAATLAAMTQIGSQTPFSTLSALTTEPPLSTLTMSISPSATNEIVITPTATQNPTLTAGPTTSPTPGLGTIAGGIYGYPYGSLPRFSHRGIWPRTTIPLLVCDYQWGSSIFR